MTRANGPHRLGRAAVAGAALASLALTGCGVLPRADARPAPVVIAADLELSGPGAAVGTVLHRALELRVEQVNSQGLLPGRELRLVVRDNGSSHAAAVDNLAELAADEQVSLIVTGGCARCVAEAAPALEEAGVPTISLAFGEIVAEPVTERRYVFQVAPRARDTAELLVAEAVRLGLRRIALVTADTGGYSREAARELAAAAEAVGLDLVASEHVGAEADAEQLRQIAARLSQWQPEPIGIPLGLPGQARPERLEAVVLWAPTETASQLALALRQAGWRGQLLLDASAAGSLFLTNDDPQRDALAGARLVFTETLVIDQAIAGSPAKAARQGWWRDYVARYGGYDAHSSFAADAIGLLVAAVSRTGSTDRDQLRDTIEATSLDGLSGPIRFTPDSHSGLQPMALTVLVAAGDRWRLAN